MNTKTMIEYIQSMESAPADEMWKYVSTNPLRGWVSQINSLEFKVDRLEEQLAEKDRIIAQLRASIEELTG